MKRRLRRRISQIVREPCGPRPPGGTWRAKLREWRERAYFHLSREEWDARVQIGMSLWHIERLAYRAQHQEQWAELEASLWPHSEWVQEIQDRRRGQS